MVGVVGPVELAAVPVVFPRALVGRPPERLGSGSGIAART